MTRQEIARQRKEDPAAFNAAVFAAIPVSRGFLCPRCGSAWHRENGGHLVCGDSFGNGCEWQGTWGEVAPPDFAHDPAQDYKVLRWVREKLPDYVLCRLSGVLGEMSEAAGGYPLTQYEPGDYAAAAMEIVEAGLVQEAA